MSCNVRNQASALYFRQMLVLGAGDMSNDPRKYLEDEKGVGRVVVNIEQQLALPVRMQSCWQVLAVHQRLGLQRKHYSIWVEGPCQEPASWHA